jgi:hypothetical protein
MIEKELKYLANGNAVYLVEELKNGQFLVSDIFLDEYGEETLSDGMHIVDYIYDVPPVRLYSKDIADLNNSISRLKDEEESLRYSISSLNEKEKYVLAKLKNFDKLQYLLDFIDGKITHYVFIRWGSVEIIDYKNSASEYGIHNLKLLSLFGDTKGDITWRLNQYSDGSGCNTDVIPCLSYDMALEEAQKAVDKFVAEKTNYRKDVIESAKKYNLNIPEEYVEAYRKEWKDQHDLSISKQEIQLAELRKKQCEI